MGRAMGDVHSNSELRKSPVFPAMNKPRLTGGIDTRLWCVSFIGMVAVMAESNSIVCGVIAFAVLWSLSRRLTANDTKACAIYLKAARFASVYDGALRDSSR